MVDTCFRSELRAQEGRDGRRIAERLIEGDALRLSWGQRLTIGVASTRLNLVTR